jgi:hypothetical protein
MDAGAITAAGVVNDWTLGGDAADLLSVKSLTLGDVANASVTVKAAQLPVKDAKGNVTQKPTGGVLGAVKALRWATGAIQADSLASLAVTGRKLSTTVSAVVGDFGAAVTLRGENLAAKKPAAGAVSIANDLAASLWQVDGPMTTLTVTHIAQGSTIRASGSITSITLGASNGSKFLAGVKDPQKLDPGSVTSADLNPLATIGTMAIKGWKVVGQAPDFFTNSSFLAPSLGTVSLLNSTPGTWDLFAQVQTTSPNLQIKSVSHKDTRDPTNLDKNWTWTSNKPMPPGGVGATTPIPS